MILGEICLVICVAILFGILNRLCEICNLLEHIKQLITNPNIVLSEEFVKHVVELLKARRSKPKSSRS